MAMIENGDHSRTAGAQTIRRAIGVLRTVAQIQRRGASLSRVARLTALSTSTAFRILRSLTEERLLRYDEVGRFYFIGPLAFELGLAAPAELNVCPVLREAVERVARETRLTTYLMVRSGGESVCLNRINGSVMSHTTPVDVGQRSPLGLGAASLAILASLDDRDVDLVFRYHQRRQPSSLGRTVTSDQLLDRVRATRERGYAVSSETIAMGMSGVGVAFPSADSFYQMAIGASAFTDRIDTAEARRIATIISVSIERYRKLQADGNLMPLLETS